MAYENWYYIGTPFHVITFFSGYEKCIVRKNKLQNSVKQPQHEE